VEQGSIDELEEKNTGLGDFIICIPDDMTKTQAPAAAGMVPSTKVSSKQIITADTLSKQNK
jgi:hypothetical protein